jgi:hypothetical protein
VLLLQQPTKAQSVAKQIGLYTYIINQSHKYNMEFLTLAEFLDANSLEHKLQAQIKAALDAADNSEGSVKSDNQPNGLHCARSEHYTEPLVQESI